MMGKPVLIWLLLVLMPGSICYGQGENNVWCFGSGCGLNFNTTPPSSFISSMATLEGCASVCDASGNLLFFASPNAVWDRTNNAMPDGMGLNGGISCTQGATIVQSYTNQQQYYLFTSNDAAYDPPPHKLYYSMVDMTLNSGYGDVIAAQKNIVLDTNMNEKMIVVKGKGCYSWLLTHHAHNEIFHAFRIDNNGISTTPVISNVGLYPVTFPAGEMKISPNDSTLVLVNDGEPHPVELYTFNSATGAVSNYVELDPSLNTPTNFYYGAAFSPDGSKLYVSSFQGTPGYLFQYDMSYMPDIQAVRNSKTVIENRYYSGGRTGPDGKVYFISRDSGYASVINNPNAAGLACNMVDSVILHVSGSTFGNDFVPNPTGVHDHSSMDTTVCLGLNRYVASGPAGYTSYLWSDGSTQQSDTFSSAGSKWVISTTYCGIRTDTFHVSAGHIDTIFTHKDTSVCMALADAVIVAQAGYSVYLWSDGTSQQQDTFSSGGTKWVLAQSGCNMLADTFRVQDQRDTNRLITDTAVCVFQSPVSINAPAGYTSYVWSDGVMLQADTFFASTTKWVNAVNGCELLSDTVHFTAIALPPDSISTHSTDTTICNSEGVSLQATAGYDSYLWSDGSTGISDTFNNTTVKQVYQQKGCKERIDTFKVRFINDLAVDLGPDTAICEGESVILDATSTANNSANYLWQDGSTGAVYHVTESGAYSVKVSVGPCSVSDTVLVHELVPAVHLGNGIIPCHADSIILDVGVDDASYLWQDGSTGRTYKATKEGNYYVKVTRDNCSITATVTVRFEGCDCVVVLPTGFSPNNDGRNDKFGATINCPVSSYKMMIYNRWGDRVFYSEDVNNRWDGSVKGVAADGNVFNYYMEFKDESGKTYYYKGTVTLVR